jgi:hypothetical protein
MIHGYQNVRFILEIQCIWDVKTKVMPGIIGTAETISESLRQYLSIPGKHDINCKKQPYWALHTY